MSLDLSGGFELLLLAAALAAALMVRPWRLLSTRGERDLTTPFLAAMTILPWLWAWPGHSGMAVPVQWSGAALAVLMLGWPLAVPVLVLSGITTIWTIDASWSDALSTIVWSGLLPASLVLGLGHAVRKAFGTHPVAYLAGRAFAVPLLVVFACTLLTALFHLAPTGTDGMALVVTSFLMAMGEASWTCAVATLLVAWRPQWLATWSDTLYLGKRPHNGRGR